MAWQPIATAPHGVEVLVFMRRKHGNITVVNAELSGTGQWWAKHVGAMTPSHWQPLPEPPEGV